MKKTTKLVGAVLGVLLVAALFVGAGAAALSDAGFTGSPYSGTIDEAVDIAGTVTGTLDAGQHLYVGETAAEVEVTVSATNWTGTYTPTKASTTLKFFMGTTME